MHKNTNRALVTGGAASDIPVVKRLKELGWTVITGGTEPKSPAHRLADEYLRFDYSKPDEVLGAARKAKVSCLIPSGHDRAVYPAAIAAEELGLPGHDAPENALKLHRKDSLKEKLRQVGISSPQNFGKAEAKDFLRDGGRLIVKPVGLAGGRGISKVTTPLELESALAHSERVSGDSSFVIEEFIEGTNHGVSLMVVDGQSHIVFKDNEYYGSNRFRVAGAHSKSDLTANQLSIVNGWIQSLVEDMRLADGLVHLQVVLQGNQVQVLEVMRRIPGDGYPLLPELASGIDFMGIFLGAYLGEDSLADSANRPTRNVIRHVVGAQEEGRFNGIALAPETSDFLIHSCIWAKNGEQVFDKMNWSAGALYFSCSDNDFPSLLSSVRESTTASVER